VTFLFASLTVIGCSYNLFSDPFLVDNGCKREKESLFVSKQGRATHKGLNEKLFGPKL